MNLIAPIAAVIIVPVVGAVAEAEIKPALILYINYRFPAPFAASHFIVMHSAPIVVGTVTGMQINTIPFSDKRPV